MVASACDRCREHKQRARTPARIRAVLEYIRVPVRPFKRHRCEYLLRDAPLSAIADKPAHFGARLCSHQVVWIGPRDQTVALTPLVEEYHAKPAGVRACVCACVWCVCVSVCVYICMRVRVHASVRLGFSLSVGVGAGVSASMSVGVSVGSQSQCTVCGHMLFIKCITRMKHVCVCACAMPDQR